MASGLDSYRQAPVPTGEVEPTDGPMRSTASFDPMA
jgi:hypothetical protein